MNNEINLDQVHVEDGNELARQHLSNLPAEEIPKGVVFDGIHCVDCGDPINNKRLELVKSCRCSECKPFHDREMRAKALQGNPDNFEE